MRQVFGASFFYAMQVIFSLGSFCLSYIRRFAYRNGRFVERICVSRQFFLPLHCQKGKDCFRKTNEYGFIVKLLIRLVVI